ncbi:helix-turn-helix domain-containing protein [Sphingomonas sp. M1-B02]|uniref:helix-turn-helix domain-containing protein n=1 Tax=Sphingomonas sp. M1-B02 TaxID=3114300 RepID=UPI00223F7FF5|nr:helix-turn-helix domain-containing protein [Sphingomonas sp. S6-11]UZK67846.1 helix-turn-helix domain-containing protein [Sphingomonas sp. S6-11]
MKITKRYGVASTREHLLSGMPITRIEALLLFGVPDLTKIVSDLKREGHAFERGRVSVADALRRLSPRAQVVPPSDLPVREISLTEYRIAR